jgi:hypothetical protein
VRKPSTSENWKRKKKVGGVPIYIILTHKRKLMGNKTKVIAYPFAQGWKRRLWIAHLVLGFRSGDGD